MAKQDDDRTATAGSGGPSGSATDSMENRMLAFAEQLGRIVGTVQAKAEGWLDRDALNAQISTVRDSASELLNQLGGGTSKQAAASRPASRTRPGKAVKTTEGAAKGKAAATPQTSAKGASRPRSELIDEWRGPREGRRYGTQRRRSSTPPGRNIANRREASRGQPAAPRDV